MSIRNWLGILQVRVKYWGEASVTSHWCRGPVFHKYLGVLQASFVWTPPWIFMTGNFIICRRRFIFQGNIPDNILPFPDWTRVQFVSRKKVLATFARSRVVYFRTISRCADLVANSSLPKLAHFSKNIKSQNSCCSVSHIATMTTCSHQSWRTCLAHLFQTKKAWSRANCRRGRPHAIRRQRDSDTTTTWHDTRTDRRLGWRWDSRAMTRGGRTKTTWHWDTGATARGPRDDSLATAQRIRWGRWCATTWRRISDSVVFNQYWRVVCWGRTAL